MKNIRLLPVLMIALAILPLSLFLTISLATLKSHIKPTVVNDPEKSLAQSVAGFGGAYNSWSDHFLMSAVRLGQMETLKKGLAAPVSQAAPLKAFCEEAALSTQSSLFILTDPKGNVLFDNLGIPKPTPSPSPSPTPKSANKNSKPKSSNHPSKPKTKQPLYASVKDWPGMAQALQGSDAGGLFPYQEDLYRVMIHPIVSREKIVGVLWVGGRLDKNFLQTMKANAGNELTLYTNASVNNTLSTPIPSLDLKKSLDPHFNHSKLNFNGTDYLVGSLPLLGIPPKAGTPAEPVASVVILQPIKQSLLIEGEPFKIIKKTGWWLLVLALLAALLSSWAFVVFPFQRLTEALEKAQKGDPNVTFPSDPVTEWGLLGASLGETFEGQKEKERVSLVLGKVVDPQAAKKILAEKDYFSLKGERRECTILQADLRGFNILSENMQPQVLVEALNQYFGIINEVVFKYEGMLDKFVGDTAVAIWGAPFSHPDKELRAVKTALEIHEALKDFNISRIKKGFPPFTVGIGIHTGTVVSGNLGSEKRYDYTVIGEPLHVVARLCAMATPGQTVVSDETYQKIRPQVKANALNPIAVKGSMEPLNTFEITQLL